MRARCAFSPHPPRTTVEAPHLSIHVTLYCLAARGGTLAAPLRRPGDALATPLRHLASLLAPHPLPAPSLPRRGASLALSLYLDCSASVAAPREAAPSMRVPVAILSAGAMSATRDAHALRAHTGVVLRPSSPP